MTFYQYLPHYLDIPGMLLMLLIAFCAIGVSLVLIYFRTVHLSKRYTRDTRADYVHDAYASLTERFYELIFSTTTVLLFVGLYFTIDYFGIGASYRQIWNSYNSFILLAFILFSVMLTNLIDKFFIPLSHVEPGERGAMRFLGMIYMLFIFIYIKFIYKDNNYDTIILYFLTLVIGRFVYFDASLESFNSAIREAIVNLPLLLLALLCSGIMAFYGFMSGFLIRQSGVVFNLFIAHLFLVFIIFLVHHSRLLKRIGKRVNE